MWRSCAKSPGGGEHINELNKKIILYNCDNYSYKTKHVTNQQMYK